MNEAHAMLLLFSTFDLSAVRKLVFYPGLDLKSFDMRGAMVSLIGRFLLPRLTRPALDLQRECSAFGGFGAAPKGGMFGAASSGGAFEGAPGQELEMLPH